MRYSTVFLSALLSAALAGAPSSSKQEEAEAGGVPQLKADNFDSFIEDNQLAMVKFFAPWCGHCIKMAEPYKAASQQLKDQSVKAAVAEVDCTIEKDLCEKHGISGYPSLKVFRATNKASALDYKGARDTESIVEYLKRLSLPAVQILKPEEIKGHVEAFKKSLVVIANMPKSHAAYAAFEKAADGLREEYSFALVEGKDNSITVHKNFDEGEVKYSKPLDKLTAEDLSAWLQEESIPLMDEISPNNYEKYINAKKPMAYLFYENDEQRKTYGEIVQKAMKPYKGKINAIYISVKDFGEHAKNLNLEPQWPGFVIHNVEENLKFPFTGKDKPAITQDSLDKFVKSYVDGKIKPNFKSEPEPDAGKQKTDNIKTIVHNNFEKVVLDKSKDVFIEVYAPWCGACKRIAPELEKLAEAYAPHQDKVLITKMDGIANDLPASAKFTLEHFPTLLLYKAGSNELVEMKQLGGAKELHEFIQANSVNKINIDTSKFAAEATEASAEEEGSAPEESDHAPDHEEL
jgi:protein disulfide-isomerase A1